MLAVLPYNWKPQSQRRLSTVYGLPSSQSFVYTLSMALVLEKTKKTRCRVFLEVVTTSTIINRNINAIINAITGQYFLYTLYVKKFYDLY